jgi:hypothetical protein
MTEDGIGIGNYILVERWLLFHYYVLRWPCILSNIWMVVEAIGSF